MMTVEDQVSVPSCSCPSGPSVGNSKACTATLSTGIMLDAATPATAAKPARTCARWVTTITRAGLRLRYLSACHRAHYGYPGHVSRSPGTGSNHTSGRRSRKGRDAQLLPRGARGVRQRGLVGPAAQVQPGDPAG